MPAALAVNAAPTTQGLAIDGKAVSNVEIYSIGGTNYFRLRDLAMLLKGTNSKFSVSYDHPTNHISLMTGSAYEPIGGELAAGEDRSESCVVSAQSVSVNGRPADIAHYNLGGTNFFRLRDLGASLGFDVDYDEAADTMVVSSERPDTELRLGVSNYYIQIPADYQRGAMTAEDVADNMVGYYRSDKSLMDFDVYQFSKQGEPTELADYAAKESAEYDATAKSGTVNGLTYYYYDATEESEGENYPTRTYILDTGTGYVELVFWLDGDTAKAEATRIINSLSGKVTLALGSSPYSITVPYDFTGGNTPSGVRVGAYQSPYSSLSFDVRQIAKDGNPAALADFAEQEAKRQPHLLLSRHGGEGRREPQGAGLPA